MMIQIKCSRRWMQSKHIHTMNPAAAYIKRSVKVTSSLKMYDWFYDRITNYTSFFNDSITLIEKGYLGIMFFLISVYHTISRDDDAIIYLRQTGGRAID